VNWDVDKLFDGVIGNQGYHSLVQSSSDIEIEELPEYENWSYAGIDISVKMFTIDLGKLSQLTRFKFWQREPYIYSHGNTKLFDLWGTENLKAEGTLEGWTLLLENKELIRPSGNSITQEIKEEDIEAAEAGHEFKISDDMPKVRYIRFVQKLSWVENSICHMSEIEFYRYKEE